MSREEAKEELKSVMRCISEDRWCAGWLTNLEYILWDELINPRLDGVLYLEQARELALLSALAGGWWTCREFLPMDEWLKVWDARPERFR